jgi:hypothetical protein
LTRVPHEESKEEEKEDRFWFAFCLPACLPHSSSILALKLTYENKNNITESERERENICNEREREGQEGSSVDFLISQAPIKSASLGKNEWVRGENKKKERINKVRIVHKRHCTFIPDTHSQFSLSLFISSVVLLCFYMLRNNLNAFIHLLLLHPLYLFFTYS